MANCSIISRHIAVDTASMIDNKNGTGMFKVDIDHPIALDPTGLLLYCIIPRSRREIDVYLNGASNRVKYLTPLIAAGLIHLTRPDRVQSRLQRYYADIDAIDDFIM